MNKNVAIVVRAVSYIGLGVASLVALVAGALGYPDVAAAASGVAATIGAPSGIMAVLNLQKAPNSPSAVRDVLGTVETTSLATVGAAAQVESAAGLIVGELRRVFPVVNDAQGAAVAPTGVADLPVYPGVSTSQV